MSAGRNSQISFRTRRGSVDTAATRSIAASTSVTSSSAPAVQQRLHQNSGRINAALQQLPPRTRLSTVARMSGTVSSRSSRRALSRTAESGGRISMPSQLDTETNAGVAQKQSGANDGEAACNDCRRSRLRHAARSSLISPRRSKVSHRITESRRHHDGRLDPCSDSLRFEQQSHAEHRTGHLDRHSPVRFRGGVQ